MDIVIDKYKNLNVLRDDTINGGSKSRFIKELLETNKKGYVYCSIGYGALQVCLSNICKQENKECIIFTPDKKIKDTNTLKVIENGGHVNFIPYGRMNVLKKRARDFIADNPNYQLITFGADSDLAINKLSDTMTKIIEKLEKEPDDIFCAVGSGTLLKGILKSTKNATIHGVVVGKDFKINNPRVILYKYPKPFSYESKLEIPFESNKNYDRKALEYALLFNGVDTFFWNVN